MKSLILVYHGGALIKGIAFEKWMYYIFQHIEIQSFVFFSHT